MVNLTVVCPLGRPDLLNVIKNWNQQTYTKARLIIVENGSGIGQCNQFGYQPDTLLKSGKHQSLAKNEGIVYALNDSWSTHWTTWDSDDYYGPRYLEKLVNLFEQGHEVVGKSASFMRLSSGKLMLLKIHGENQAVNYVQGPTIGSKLWGSLPLFDPGLEWGEDNAWLDDVRAMDKTVYAGDQYDFCYIRKGYGHTYPHSDVQLLSFCYGDTYYCGDFNTNVIDGVVPLETRLKISLSPLSMNSYPTTPVVPRSFLTVQRQVPHEVLKHT